MYVGASRAEAEDATAAAMEETLRRWGELDMPLAYARRAAASSFFKERSRGLARVRRRQSERDNAVPGSESLGRGDQTLWDDRDWVLDLLGRLPPGQREVTALVVDGYRPAEIASVLGRSSAAVRRSLCDARIRLKTILAAQPAAGHDQPTAAHATVAPRADQ